PGAGRAGDDERVRRVRRRRARRRERRHLAGPGDRGLPHGPHHRARRARSRHGGPSSRGLRAVPACPGRRPRAVRRPQKGLIVYSADPAGLVRTVLGDVTPDTLGAMLIHEHLLTAPPAFALHEDPDLEFGTPDGAAAEVADLVEAGGGGLVELTTADYGRDVTAALAAARATGARIVQGTGLQKGIYYPAGTTRRSSEELAADFVRDIREGFGPEHTRAGAIKAGTCSTEELWDVERTVLRAAALAAKETGAPTLTHTQAGRLGHDQLDVFESAGLDLSQVCVGHLDRNLEEDYLVSLARRGVWLGLDQWTKDKYGHDTDRA